MDKIILLSIIFFFVSTLFSMIGMGGGILYVPILLFAGYSMKEAPVISLILIMATSLSALFNFWKNKKVDWKLALVIDPPTDIMAFFGGYFSGFVSEIILKGILAVILLVSSIMMMTNRIGENKRKIQKKKWWYWYRNFNGVEYAVNLPVVLIATAFIGLLSGMLGITGGIIKLPIMVLLCGVPMDIAVATSTAMVAATAMFGILGHTVIGIKDVQWQTGIILSIMAVLGGLIGSKLSISINKLVLKRIFSVLIMMIAIKILIQLI